MRANAAKTKRVRCNRRMGINTNVPATNTASRQKTRANIVVKLKIVSDCIACAAIDADAENVTALFFPEPYLESQEREG